MEGGFSGPKRILEAVGGGGLGGGDGLGGLGSGGCLGSRMMMRIFLGKFSTPGTSDLPRVA